MVGGGWRVWGAVEGEEQCVLCMFVMYVFALFACGTTLKTRCCISRVCCCFFFLILNTFKLKFAISSYDIMKTQLMSCGHMLQIETLL